MRFSILVIVLTSLLLDACARDCRTGSFGDNSDDWRAIRLDSPWMSHVKECDVAGYLVDGPAGPPYGDLLLSRDGKQVISITSSNEIIVFGKDGEVALTVQDRNGDGVFDFVSYKAAATGGYIEDGDMDGQPDMKSNAGGQALISIDGKWFPLERRGDVRGVVIDAAWRPVLRKGGRWELAPPSQ
jgi:hypothetical protein